MKPPIATGRLATLERPGPDLVAPELAEEIRRRYEQHLRLKIQVSNSASNRASSLGDVCDRRRVLRRTRGREARPPSVRLQAIFEQGKRGERQTKLMLAELGIDLLGAQRDFPQNDYNITGHVDAIVEWRGRKMVGEIKQVGAYFDSLNTIEDVRDHRFTSKWYGQVNIYSYLAQMLPGSAPEDFTEYLFIFEGKLTSELKLIPGAIDYAMVEKLLANAEADNAHVAAGTLPDFYPIRAECQKCDFCGAVCQPPLEHGPGVQIITEEDLIDAARTRFATEMAALQFKRADEFLKERLRGVETAVIGDVAVVRGKFTSYTRYDVPREVKEPYKVVDPKGAFRITYEKIGEAPIKES